MAINTPNITIPSSPPPAVFFPTSHYFTLSPDSANTISPTPLAAAAGTTTLGTFAW